MRVARSSGLTAKLRSHCCISTAGAWGALKQRRESGRRGASRSAISSITMMCSSWVWLRMEAILRYWLSVETTAMRAPESIQQDGDLLGGQGGIDGHIDSAQHQGSEVHHRPLPTILRQQGDAVAFENAPGAKDVRQGIDASQKLVAGYGEPVTRRILPQDSALALAGRDQRDYIH